MTPEPVTRMNELLAPLAEAHAARLGVPATFRWPLGPAVAAAFLRAYDEELVVVGSDGRLRFPRFRKPCADGWGVFFKARLALAWAESFTQIGFGADLVVDAGWKPSWVQLEDHPFDIGVYVPGRNRPVILAEAKPKANGSGSASALAAGVYARAGGPPVQLSPTDQVDVEKKYQGLLARRPNLFAVSGPGVLHAFRVRYRAGTTRLSPVAAEALAAV
jgi:hypothetical protein